MTEESAVKARPNLFSGCEDSRLLPMEKIINDEKLLHVFLDVSGIFVYVKR